MKRFFWFIAVCFLGIVSCVSGPEPLPQEPAPVVQPAPVAPVPVTPAPVVVAPVVPEPVAPPPPEPESPPVEEVFDSTNVSEEVYLSTKADIQRFAENLNEIIRRRDYQGWIANLDADYLEEMSSPEYLEETSNNPSYRLKTQKIVLKTLQDYFTHVIVPSRANDKVGDIEFISPTRVKAFAVTSNNQKLRLYELVNIAGVWKIASPL